jgi:hypothetical protein
MEQIFGFPRMVVKVNLVGHNSLLGGLCVELQKKGYLKGVGFLYPEEIVFVIKKLQDEVNLYEELNKVRDVLKIDEKVITLFIQP